MRYYLPGIGRFVSRVHLHEAVAMGRTTYEELRNEWGINIGPLGTPEAFARNRVPEHSYRYCANNPGNCIDPAGLWGIVPHYTGTAVWAHDVGFCNQPSRAIADADLATDNQALYPSRVYHMAALTGDLRHQMAAQHFQQAIQAAKLGNCAAVWENLGHGLHALQDHEAHGHFLFHVSWFDDPSKTLYGLPDLSLSRLQATEQVTKAYLGAALADPAVRCCLRTCGCP
jgi:hypothetical protein